MGIDTNFKKERVVVNFNSLWYLGLAILSIILLFYVCFKKGIGLSLLLLLTMVGLGYLIEAVIYNFFASYQYYPKLIKHDPIYDSNLGALSSNALALPVVATFISTFRKNWLWILFFTGLFAGIEWLFLELHLYTHNWWKIGYTSFGLPVYFLFAIVFHQKLIRPLHGVLHTLILFLIIDTFSGTMQIFPIMFFSSRYYQFGWFENRSQDTTAFAVIFYVCACLFYVAMTKIHFIPKWVKYVSTAISMYITTILLREAGILHSLVWWDTWYYVILSTISLWFTETISKRLSIGP
jgi:hypothetical protein